MSSPKRLGNRSHNIDTTVPGTHKIGFKVDSVGVQEKQLQSQHDLEVHQSIITRDGVVQKLSLRAKNYDAQTLITEDMHIDEDEMLTMGVSVRQFEQTLVGYAPIVDKDLDHNELREKTIDKWTPNLEWKVGDRPSEMLVQSIPTTSNTSTRLTELPSRGDGIVQVHPVGTQIWNAYSVPLEGTKAFSQQEDYHYYGGPLGDELDAVKANRASKIEVDGTLIQSNGAIRPTVQSYDEKWRIAEFDRDESKKKAQEKESIGYDPEVRNPFFIPDVGGRTGYQKYNKWKAQHAGGVDVHGRFVTSEEFTGLLDWYDSLFVSIDSEPPLFSIISTLGHSRDGGERQHNGYDLWPTENTRLTLDEPGLYSFHATKNGTTMTFIPTNRLVKARITRDGVERSVYDLMGRTNKDGLNIMRGPGTWMPKEGLEGVAVLHMQPGILNDRHRTALKRKMMNEATKEWYYFESNDYFSVLALESARSLEFDGRLSCPILTAGELHYHVEFPMVRFTTKSKPTFTSEQNQPWSLGV